ncbi:C-C chemokine receptor type 6 [Triplophysa tibetana]|uniref:C-C chemokine receptor type 6 n=1 Tax=Triplophysa tibetana TaxID=1572043 RepID=A0A5A9NH53_9TELE|nr:C-C chemokine receptor type 6 [Triplophysa tibetana]
MENDFNDLSNNDSYTYDYNSTEGLCSVDHKLHVERFLQLYIHPIICIVGFIGNTLVIVTYALYKRTKSMTDVYLLNVAIADIMFVVALPLIIYSERHGWAMGNWSCKLLRGVYSVNLYSGMLLLACISGDRYLAIVQARRSYRLRSSTLLYSRLVCALVWSLALVLSLPTFIFYQRYQPSPFEYVSLEDSNYTVSNDSPYVCFFRFTSNVTAKTFKIAVPSAQVGAGFFLPLLIMGFCYISVIATLLRAKNFQRHKAVRVVLTVVLVFVACHTPYNLALLYRTATILDEQECSHEEAVELTIIITESLAYLHSCLNPLLYAFIGVNFRNHFRKIIEDIWCFGKNYMSARRSSRVTSEMYMSTRRSVDGSNSDYGTSFTM